MKLAEAYAIAAEKMGLLADATGVCGLLRLDPSAGDATARLHTSSEHCAAPLRCCLRHTLHATPTCPSLSRHTPMWCFQAGEEPGRPQKEDVLQQLGMKTQQQKKHERAAAKKAAKKGGKAAAAPAEAEEGWTTEEEEAEEEAEGRGQQGDQQPPAGKPQQQPAGNQQQQQGSSRQLAPDEWEAVAFVPSKAFTGARPGYAFKKGSQGLGYYLDPVQQLQQQQQGGGGGKRTKAGGDPSKQAQKTEWQALKQKYSHAPIGGRAGADGHKPATGGKARREAAAAAKPAAAKQPAKAASAPVPLLPGRLKELKRQRQQAAAAGKLEGFSSDDDEGPAAAVAPASKRIKALPGRLRKKLAKAKAGGQD